MKCETVNKIFMDYISGTIDPETKKEIDEHIIGCSDCRKMIEETGYVWSKVIQGTQEEPDPVLRIYFDSMVKTYSRILETRASATGW